jgi:hypothetical protein
MTTPAGSLSLAQDHLRTMLADAAAFRTWCSAADQAAALAKIFHEGLPKPANGETHTRAELENYRPYAVIFTDDQNGFSRNLDAEGSFEASGRLKLRLYQTADDDAGDEPTSDANLRFKNAVGAILDDLCAAVATAGYLAFERIRVDAGPYWAHPKLVPDQGVWQGVEIGIDWRGT